LDDSNDTYVEIGEWQKLEGCVIRKPKAPSVEEILGILDK
jgi:hypothetical protein